MNKPKVCALCQRPAPLTKHHLIPRTYHRNKKFLKLFAKEEMRSRLLWLCRPCHNHIHSCFSERELGLDLNSLEKLLAREEVTDFADWLKGKDPHFKPKQRRLR